MLQQPGAPAQGSSAAGGGSPEAMRPLSLACNCTEQAAREGCSPGACRPVAQPGCVRARRKVANHMRSTLRLPCLVSSVITQVCRSLMCSLCSATTARRSTQRWAGFSWHHGRLGCLLGTGSPLGATLPRTGACIPGAAAAGPSVPPVSERIGRRLTTAQRRRRSTQLHTGADPQLPFQK